MNLIYHEFTCINSVQPAINDRAVQDQNYKISLPRHLYLESNDLFRFQTQIITGVNPFINHLKTI